MEATTSSDGLRTAEELHHRWSDDLVLPIIENDIQNSYQALSNPTQAEASDMAGYYQLTTSGTATTASITENESSASKSVSGYGTTEQTMQVNMISETEANSPGEQRKGRKRLDHLRKRFGQFKNLMSDTERQGMHEAAQDGHRYPQVGVLDPCLTTMDQEQLGHHLDMSQKGFDPTLFILQDCAACSFEELNRKAALLQAERDNRQANLRTIIYDNFEAFVDVTSVVLDMTRESTSLYKLSRITSLRKEMEEIEAALNTIEQALESNFGHLSKTEARLQNLKQIMSLVAKRAAYADKPNRIKKCLKENNYFHAALEFRQCCGSLSKLNSANYEGYISSYFLESLKEVERCGVDILTYYFETLNHLPTLLSQVSVVAEIFVALTLIRAALPSDLSPSSKLKHFMVVYDRNFDVYQVFFKAFSKYLQQQETQLSRPEVVRFPMRLKELSSCLSLWSEAVSFNKVLSNVQESSERRAVMLTSTELDEDSFSVLSHCWRADAENSKKKQFIADEVLQRIAQAYMSTVARMQKESSENTVETAWLQLCDDFLCFVSHFVQVGGLDAYFRCMVRQTEKDNSEKPDLRSVCQQCFLGVLKETFSSGGPGRNSFFKDLTSTRKKLIDAASIALAVKQYFEQKDTKKVMELISNLVNDRGMAKLFQLDSEGSTFLQSVLLNVYGCFEPFMTQMYQQLGARFKELCNTTSVTAETGYEDLIDLVCTSDMLLLADQIEPGPPSFWTCFVNEFTTSSKIPEELSLQSFKACLIDDRVGNSMKNARSKVIRLKRAIIARIVKEYIHAVKQDLQMWCQYQENSWYPNREQFMEKPSHVICQVLAKFCSLSVLVQRRVTDSSSRINILQSLASQVVLELRDNVETLQDSISSAASQIFVDLVLVETALQKFLTKGTVQELEKCYQLLMIHEDIAKSSRMKEIQTRTAKIRRHLLKSNKLLLSSF